MDGFSSGFSVDGFKLSVWCSPCSPSGHFVSEEGVGQDHAVFSGKMEEGMTVDVGLHAFGKFTDYIGVGFFFGVRGLGVGI